MPGVRLSSEVQLLFEQYPELGAAYDAAAQEYGDCPEVRVTARVDEASADLMFRLPDDVPGNGWWIIENMTHADQRGVRREWYLPVNMQGQVGSKHGNTAASSATYVREYFEHSTRDWSEQPFGEDPNVVVRSIVWVCQQLWFQETDVQEAAAESAVPILPMKMEVDLTLFQAPSYGWRWLYRAADPFRNVQLVGSRLLQGANVYSDPFVIVLYDRFNRLCMEFQDDVWNKGLGDVVEASLKRGMSGRYGDVTLRTFDLAGRIMLTFSRGGDTFTMVGFSGVPNPVFHCVSVTGTAPHVESLVREVINFWHFADDSLRRAVHREDPTVSL